MTTENSLDKPSEYGELMISFLIEPVSLQSSSSKRKHIKDEIKKVTTKFKYLLSGDVKVEIQWFLHEQERYESSDSPDIDNIIKPILDGLSGPEGILIDDCQVQAIGSHWIDWNKHEHRVNIFIKYMVDDYVVKEGLIFVNIGDNLFIPLNANISIEEKVKVLEHLKIMFDLKAQILSKTKNYYEARMLSPVQRIFHKSRIFKDFKIVELEELKNELEKNIK